MLIAVMMSYLYQWFGSDLINGSEAVIKYIFKRETRDKGRLKILIKSFNLHCNNSFCFLFSPKK